MRTLPILAGFVLVSLVGCSQPTGDMQADATNSNDAVDRPVQAADLMAQAEADGPTYTGPVARFQTRLLTCPSYSSTLAELKELLDLREDKWTGIERRHVRQIIEILSAKPETTLIVAPDVVAQPLQYATVRVGREGISGAGEDATIPTHGTTSIMFDPLNVGSKQVDFRYRFQCVGGYATDGSPRAWLTSGKASIASGQASALLVPSIDSELTLIVLIAVTTEQVGETGATN